MFTAEITHPLTQSERRTFVMKVNVVHDDKGAIKSVGFPSQQLSGIGVRPGPGQHVSVVEIADVEHAGDLTKYAKDYRVDTHGSQPRFVKK
jgi:hypothetical protein